MKMAHYTADEVITMMDVSDLEDEEPSDQESDDDSENPEFPLPHSNSGAEESDDQSPTHSGSLL